MKNIFLLPTEEPSNLVLIKNTLFLTTTKDFDSIVVKFKNIYITNDDEIKEGDWVFNQKSREYYKITNIDELVNYEKKIILTTDHDLIKDGVQAIDDDFLEWFVKNPTCEEISTKLIEFEVDMELGDSCIEYGKYYKIIIPQGEPKLTNNCPKCGLDLIEREGSKPYCTDIDCRGIILDNETLREFAARKQESVETAARKLLYEKYPYHHPKYGGYFMDMFIEGAKWAEERTNK